MTPTISGALPRGSTGRSCSRPSRKRFIALGELRAIYWSGYGEDHLERFGFDEADYRIAFEIKRGGQMETNTIQFGKPSPHPSSLRRR